MDATGFQHERHYGVVFESLRADRPRVVQLSLGICIASNFAGGFANDFANAPVGVYVGLRAVDEAIDDLIQSGFVAIAQREIPQSLLPNKSRLEVCALFQGADRFIRLAMQENRLSLPLESQID